jgi:hypothetical protein
MHMMMYSTRDDMKRDMFLHSFLYDEMIFKSHDGLMISVIQTKIFSEIAISIACYLFSHRFLHSMQMQHMIAITTGLFLRFNR